MSKHTRTLPIDQKDRVETGAVSFQYPDGDTEGVMMSCRKCQKSKPIEDFFIKRGKRTTLCLDCKRSYFRGLYNSQLSWEYQIQKDFGIDAEEYHRILELQKGVCAICSRPEIKRHARTKVLYRLAVDHDHQTGRVRGLLCHRCNTALGKLGDNLGAFQKVMNYLKGDTEKLLEGTLQ